MSRRRTRRLLDRHAHLSDPRGDPPTYDARVLDYLRRLHGEGHRELTPVEHDWLTRYRKENP